MREKQKEEDERQGREMQLKKEENTQRTKDYIKQMKSGNDDKPVTSNREDRQRYLEELIKADAKRK